MSHLPVLRPSDLAELHMGDIPMVVLSDNLRSAFSFTIKRHTKGYYNHAMLMHRPGLVATQELVLRVRPIGDYLNGFYRVKFWELPTVDVRRREAVLQRVDKDLARPWYRRRYDPLGIVGQALRIRAISSPWAFYCSEWVASVVGEAGLDMGRYPSPADIDRFCQANGWRCRGVLDPYLLG